MGYVDKADRMTNSYGISRKTWKWTKILFFHLLDITILNSYLLHKSVGGKMSHKTYRETLVRNLLTEVQGASSRTATGRPIVVTSQLSRLEVKFSQHWPLRGNRRRCRVCSDKKKIVRTQYACKKCNVRLCVDECFEKWHTRVKFIN